MAKRQKLKDPFYKRESLKYTHPIPSREFIMEHLEKKGPLKYEEIIQHFKLLGEEELEAIRRRLKAMVRDGQLIYTRRGGYGLIKKMDLISGHVQGHREGFGFFIPEEGGEDLFLNARQMRRVFDGDRVLAREVSTGRRGKSEAEIIEVITRKFTHLVGRYIVEHGVGFVVPDNAKITQDIIIPNEFSNQAKHGQYVNVEIITYPTIRSQAVGRISEVLGEHLAPGLEVELAIRSYQLPHGWPDEVIAESEKFDPTVKKSEIAKRKDLCAKPFVTIDGEDAKDFDDAVFCEKHKNGGWTLYVAIADVSHYVKPGSLLDEEAYQRGNSVYFPGQVIPMLPENLSNNLCSLRPNRDRLVMVCEMSVSKSGQLKRHRFYEGVIHSKARLTYTNVYKMLVKQDKKLQKQYQDLLPHLQILYSLYQVLHKNRKYRGALDFDTVETRVKFGKNRKIEKIIPVERNEAHKLIEECMLLANVAASITLLSEKTPALYRVHESPHAEKINELREFLKEFGLSIRNRKKPRTKDFAEVLESLEDKPEKHLIQTVLLRSLTQAKYQAENVGHFGLAYEGYTHFTSPIRRYPDLIVHRALKFALIKNQRQKYKYDQNYLNKLGVHCSMTERRADDATRDVLLWLKCEYLKDKIGQAFKGVISGVTSFGFFVELENVYVDGLVHVTSLLKDYYHFNAARHQLVGEKTKKIYRLGDKVKVKLIRVDLDDRLIDLEVVSR